MTQRVVTDVKVMRHPNGSHTIWFYTEVLEVLNQNLMMTGHGQWVEAPCVQGQGGNPFMGRPPGPNPDEFRTVI